MWAIYLFQSKSSSLLPLLWVVACLASFFPLGLLFYVVVKLKKLNAAPGKTSKTEKLSTWSVGSLKIQPSKQQINAGKIGGILLIACAATFAMARHSYQQRGFCTPTGDISHSDGMTVLSKFSPHCYWVRGKDGIDYKFCVNPTTQTDWQPGAFVEIADYEYRNGFADFTVPGGRLKVWEEGVLHESRW